MTTGAPRKDQRIEFRTSVSDRDLFARAAEATGVPLSTFANDELRIAAQRVLADRTRFVLDSQSQRAWDEIMDRPAREVEGLRELLGRPSPFVD